MTTVAVRLFGQPAVVIDGRDAAITARPLELLVRLAVALPDGVTAERLVRDIWGSAGSTDGALRVTVSRLRGSIGHQHVRFDRGAYRLVDVDVDLHRFERAVRLATELSVDERVEAFERALMVAEAAPFEGMRERPWIEPVLHRVDELVEDTVDAWAEALVQTDRAARRLPDLVAALDRAPMRERRCAVVATALYRAGRQADALRAIGRTRQTLRDELGVHLGSELAELERRMLRHDPELSGRRSSDVEIDVEVRLRAAQALSAAGAHEDARAILDGAEQICRPTSRQMGFVELARARVAVTAGDRSAVPHVERAQRIARELRDGQLLARAALALVSTGVPDDRAAALIALTEPLDLLDPHAPERVDLLCAAAVFVVFIDASDVMHRLLAEAERLAGYREDRRAELVLLVARSLVDSLDPSRADRSARDAEAALALARELGRPELVVTALQACLRAWYGRGDLVAVDDVIDELERTSRDGALAFGQVRAHLCRASNAVARGDLDLAERHAARAHQVGTRLRTFAVDGAVRTLDALIAIERGRHEETLALAMAIEADRGPTAWAALAAWSGDDATASRLLDIAGQLPRDDAFPTFAALSAEVAARRHDPTLGAWCQAALTPLSGRTVLVGLGTAVLGFADHFLALATVATGDLHRAAELLTRSRDAARSAGARLWEDRSTVELAAVLATLGDRPAARRALGAVDQTTTSVRVRRRLDEVRFVLADTDDMLTG